MIETFSGSRETKVQRERPVRRYCGGDSGLEVVGSKEAGRSFALGVCLRDGVNGDVNWSEVGEREGKKRQ